MLHSSAGCVVPRYGFVLLGHSASFFLDLHKDGRLFVFLFRFFSSFIFLGVSNSLPFPSSPDNIPCFLIFSFTPTSYFCSSANHLSSLQAGRLPQLDTLARQFFKSTSEAERLDLVAATLNFDSPNGEAKYYVYIMNKIGGKGNDYVEQESKRCVYFDRLLAFWVIIDLLLFFLDPICTTCPM